MSLESQELAEKVLKNKRLLIASKAAIIAAYKSKIDSQQYFKCQQFGHYTHTCKNAVKCQICSKNHPTRLHICRICETTGQVCVHTVYKCSNCGENHRANSKECNIVANIATKKASSNKSENLSLNSSQEASQNINQNIDQNSSSNSS